MMLEHCEESEHTLVLKEIREFFHKKIQRYATELDARDHEVFENEDLIRRLRRELAQTQETLSMYKEEMQLRNKELKDGVTSTRDMWQTEVADLEMTIRTLESKVARLEEDYNRATANYENDIRTTREVNNDLKRKVSHLEEEAGRAGLLLRRPWRIPTLWQDPGCRSTSVRRRARSLSSIIHWMST